ncbi:hypothetical protein COK28_07125 [Bacillus cereus]|nr:hypothetical protein COK28_07125 [Bacillus cereus]
MTKKMTADEILGNMYKMDDAEKIELLMALSEKHFEGNKSIEEIQYLKSITIYEEDEEEGNNDQKTCKEMIEYMKNMGNGESSRFLYHLFHKHSDSRITVGVNAPTKAYIEGYLERKITTDEIVIMKLAYDWGHFVGGKRGMKQV